MTREDDLGHGDIEAALATRRELGARYDAELVDGFAERIERAVDRRVADQVALQQRRTAAVAGAGARQLALGIISLVAFIPISIALGVNGAVPGPARHADRHRRRQRRPRLAVPRPLRSRHAGRTPLGGVCRGRSTD